MNHQIKTLEEYVIIFREIADKDECDGDCDSEAPYRSCKECTSRRVLNEIYEILKEESYEILKEADVGAEKDAMPSV
jgi:hypothetical protein